MMIGLLISNIQYIFIVQSINLILKAIVRQVKFRRFCTQFISEKLETLTIKPKLKRLLNLCTNKNLAQE